MGRSTSRERKGKRDPARVTISYRSNIMQPDDCTFELSTHIKNKNNRFNSFQSRLSAVA